MLSAHLNNLLQAQQPSDFGRLGQHLPYAWVEQAVHTTGMARLRHRRLPAEQVVWLVTALALYRHQSISEIVDDLDLALQSATTPFVSKSAIAQARQRTGYAPPAWLFHQSADAWSQQDTPSYGGVLGGARHQNDRLARARTRFADFFRPGDDLHTAG